MPIFKTIAIFIFLTLGLYASEFEQAVEDYKNGGYIKALNTFYELAKKENAKAQYNVGLIYANGYGVKQNMAEAQKWYEKAAKQGNSAAQYNLGALYHASSLSDAHAYEKAKYWYEKAAEDENKEAYNNLGALYLQGLGVEKNEKKALELFEKAASLGNSAAQVNAATLYAWGEGIRHDKMKAYENLKKALKSGESEASEYLDKLCQESTWVCQE
ncbi:MAG: tetratricopeptide repeat protein [Campylobacterota bacterium]|nr:tetratricopeptide repeat protein [Campylobacterota bacterium]